MNLVAFGATSAIVHATLKHWPRKSDPMVLLGRSPAKLEAVAQDLQVRGFSVRDQITVDMEDRAQIDACLHTLREGLDAIGVLLVGTGYLPVQALARSQADEAERTMQVNYNAVVHVLTGLHDVFVRQKCGTLAVITSVAADRGRASNYVYASAKAGVSTYLSGLRQELFRHGVDVVDVRPGFVDTPMTRDFPKGILWADPDAVGRHIASGIAGGKPSVLYTPSYWRWILLAVRSTPEFVFKRLGGPDES